MGTNNSKNNSDTIHWNKYKTDNISSSLPGQPRLSKDARMLLSNLTIPNISTDNESDFNLNKLTTGNNKNEINKLVESTINNKIQQLNNNSLSDTSVFISSEMYNNIVNSKTSETQSVSGKQNTIMVGGNIDNSSSTAITSSTTDKELSEALKSASSSTTEDNKEKNREKYRKQNTKKNQPKRTQEHTEEHTEEDDEKEKQEEKDDEDEENNENVTTQSKNEEEDDEDDEDEDEEAEEEEEEEDVEAEAEEADEESVGGNLSYVSSTAHTEGLESDNENTVTDHNSNNKLSVNTSDINMLS